MERLRQPGPVAAHRRVIGVRPVVAHVAEQITGRVLRHRHAELEPERHVGHRRTVLTELVHRQAAHQHEPAPGVQLVGPPVDDRTEVRQRERLAVELVDRHAGALEALDQVHQLADLVRGQLVDPHRRGGEVGASPGGRVLGVGRHGLHSGAVS